MTLEAALEYSEIPVGKTLWDLDPENITTAMDRVCEFIPSDTPAVGGILKIRLSLSSLAQKATQWDKLVICSIPILRH